MVVNEKAEPLAGDELHAELLELTQAANTAHQLRRGANEGESLRL